MKVAVVGSGPAAAGALSALVGKGFSVDVLDAGHVLESEGEALRERARAGRLDGADRRVLARGLDAPAASLLRELYDLRSFLPGAGEQEKLIHKLSFGSAFTYRDVERWIPLGGDSPHIPRSLAFGGLSNTWGGASYAMSDSDFADWPISPADMAPHYAAAAHLLGLAEMDDSLSRLYPFHSTREHELPSSDQARALHARWRQHADELEAEGFRFGRSRLAVLAEDPQGSDDPGNGEGRAGCRACGLCLHGCPHDSIWNGAFAVRRLEAEGALRYRGGRVVLRLARDGRGVRVYSVAPDGGSSEEDVYDAVVLAAGTLSSLRIVADSMDWGDASFQLLDNDMFLVPCDRTDERAPFDPEVPFVLSQLVLALDNPAIAPGRLHGQLYTYSEYAFARFDPLRRLLPGPLRRWFDKRLFNTLILFVYLDGKHSRDIRARVRRSPTGRPATLEITSRRRAGALDQVSAYLQLVRRNRDRLGLVPRPLFTQRTTTGHSGHLSGALPMRAEPGPYETDAAGRLAGWPEVRVVDASVFPSLPAQNSTYTAVANAHRIATLLVREASSSPVDGNTHGSLR